MARETRTLTADRLREALHYNPDTGAWTWRKTGAGRRPDMVAGTINSAGYLIINISGHLYLGHRLAWLWMIGEWPPHDIDHINLVRLDNHWVNLRAATRSENHGNKRAYTCNKSGFKGVFSHKQKWRARIGVNGSQIHLGVRDTREEAAALYARAAEKYYGEFARIA